MRDGILGGRLRSSCSRRVGTAQWVALVGRRAACGHQSFGRGRVAPWWIALVPWVTLSVAGAMASCGPPASKPVRAADSCTVRVSTSAPLVLDDGTTVSLDAESLGWDSGTLFVVGSYTHLWPRGAARGSNPIKDGSAIGILRDSSGQVQAVPNPLRDRRILYPRVASAGPRGWHVIFSTVESGTRTGPGPLDSASLWYSRFDGERWAKIEQVAKVTNATLQAWRASDLIAFDDRLSFAFSFDGAPTQPTRGPGRSGVVLAQRRNGKWSADTLETPDAPAYVQLIAGREGARVKVGIVQSDVRIDRVLAPSLFLASHDSVWRPAVLFAGDGKIPVDRPVFRTIGNRTIAAWVRQSDVNGGIRLALTTQDISSDRPISQVIAEGPGVEDYEMIVLGSDHLMWLHRDGGSHTRTRVLLGDGIVRDLGTIEIPLDNPRPRAVAISPSEMLVISSKLGATNRDVPAVTYVTQLRLNCRERG